MAEHVRTSVPSPVGNRGGQPQNAWLKGRPHAAWARVLSGSGLGSVRHLRTWTQRGSGGNAPEPYSGRSG